MVQSMSSLKNCIPRNSRLISTELWSFGCGQMGRLQGDRTDRAQRLPPQTPRGSKLQGFIMRGDAWRNGLLLDGSIKHQVHAKLAEGRG